MGSNKWDPFKDLMALKERMNQLFETSLSRELELASTVGAGAWAPTCDVLETDKGMLVLAEVPGLDDGDFEVVIEGGDLVIRGERKLDREKPGQASIHRLEGRYGAFARSFELPDWASGAGESDVEAKYDKGILEILVSRNGEARKKKVKVQVERQN